LRQNIIPIFKRKAVQVVTVVVVVVVFTVIVPIVIIIWGRTHAESVQEEGTDLTGLIWLRTGKSDRLL
jgi:hypothetical protein